MASTRQISIDVDVHRAIERARRSFDESESDILRRLLLDPAERRIRNGRRRPGARGGIRVRGLWSVEINGRRVPAANMKDAYRTLLIELGDISPEFLERFAEEGTRSRQFIARTPEALYMSSPHLAREHARVLDDGWYFDANLSLSQVAKRARIASRLAGLRYGHSVRLRDNLREI